VVLARVTVAATRCIRLNPTQLLMYSGMDTMTTAVAPSPQEREKALQELLDSQTFARSEQLKNFLRYVCELEISGRGEEIKEYSIGVQALGRPPTYSTTADSSVRRRAFELRHKLEEAYRTELASSPVLIDLPKGSYVPVFSYRTEVQIPRQPRLWQASSTWLVLTALSGLLMGVFGGSFLSKSATNKPAAILSEAFGPMALPQGNVLISVASNFHLVVRAGAFSPDSDLPVYPAPPEIHSMFRKTNPLPDGSTLNMRPALNVASLGVVGGVAAAAATLRSFGVQYQILPERSAPLTSFRNRNVILFGDSLNSFAAAQLLNRAYLTVAQDPSTNRLVIRDRRKPATDPPVFQRREGRKDGPAEVYGLLTILPTDGTPGEQHRTIIVSGISQAGIEGAMEFFTSANSLSSLKDIFTKQGRTAFPGSYQLVIRCTAEDSLPLSCGYAAHYLLEP